MLRLTKMCRLMTLSFLFNVLQLIQIRSSYAFIPAMPEIVKSQQYIQSKNVFQSRGTALFSTSSEEITDSKTQLEIVLFGIGDLRVSDHAGLNSALDTLETLSSASASESLSASASTEETTTKILPLLILSTEDTLANLPGLSSYTSNMATMISTAISSLSHELKSQHDLDLEIQSGQSISIILSNVIENLKTQRGYDFGSINIHVSDLGEADNNIGYSPYKYVESLKIDGADNVEIKPWSCNLRNNPCDNVRGENVSEFPDTFPEYEKMYCDSSKIVQPLSQSNVKVNADLKLKPESTSIPTVQAILSLLEASLRYNNPSGADTTIEKIPQAQNSGLYGTHWGGAHGSICTEDDALSCLEEYSQNCGCDDDAFMSSKYYKGKVMKNEASLEHASISWMSKNNNGGVVLNSKNLIKGEMVIRYLSAPLFLGCISKRQIYHAGNKVQVKKSVLSGLKEAVFGEEKTVLEEFIENREWQDLFAAKNIRKADENVAVNKVGSLAFKYWRWHGFLCRYAVSQLLPSDESKSSGVSHNIVLVHGFGASSGQWARTIAALAAEGTTTKTTATKKLGMAFAPDLIGFGQSLKPPLSYTQYLWESYASSFIRDIVINEYSAKKFVLGGNSIGGYTAMATAADDTIVNIQGKVSASGAPGTGLCDGVVLMNSAGIVMNEDEVNKEIQKGNMGAKSVAELTSENLLDPCSPPPRAVAYLGGNALLSYLRPRIKSITVPLYPSNPSNVDKNLCENILRDSLDPGAINVMVSGSKLPRPRTANELLSADHGASTSSVPMKEGRWKGPVIVTQGMKDPLNDATGRAQRFEKLRDGVEIWPLMEGGHCPHDELPDDVARGIMQWIDKRNDDTKSNNDSSTPTKVPFFCEEAL